MCILVIPGLSWNKIQIQKLRALQNNGIEVAAHGWIHRATNNKTLFHKIHSLVISANCAEHLSKNKKAIFEIINDSYSWFITNGFQKPLLYVPPAWALGNVSKTDLSRMSFTHYECTTGVIYNQKYHFLPLLGFEEKSPIKALIRRFFNLLNYCMAYFTGLIRIAIHPNDFSLYLKNDIEKYLSKSSDTVLLNELR